MAYKSKGTVRLKRTRIGSGDPSWELIFVPDTDHSVKHESGDYAVFFDSTSRSKFNRGKIVDQDEEIRGVRVIVEGYILSDPLAIPLLVSVAVEQKKVEIEVKISRNVELINIAQPAP